MNVTANSDFHSACHSGDNLTLNLLSAFPLESPPVHSLLMPIGTIRMRATQPHFPSISFVLSQVSSPMQLPSSHSNLSPQKSEPLMPPIHDDLMVRLNNGPLRIRLTDVVLKQTVDERSYISHAGLNMTSVCHS